MYSSMKRCKVSCNIFTLSEGSKFILAPGVGGDQGTTVTLTAPAFLSLASANARAISSSETW